MYAYIKGKLAYKEASFVVIEANGVGFHINIPLSTYTALEDEEHTVLNTHLQVREDAHTLYGFKTALEKSVFLDLISISGVGPSTAMAALSSMSSTEIKNGIAKEDQKQVQSIKGVGLKTAQRIILELKDKYQKEGLTGEVDGNNLPNLNNTMKSEALTALTTLGINKVTAEKTIDKILKKNTAEINLEQLIKLALKSS